MSAKNNNILQREVRRSSKWNGKEYVDYRASKVTGLVVPYKDTLFERVEDTDKGIVNVTYTTKDGEVLGTNTYKLTENYELTKQLHTANFQKDKNTYSQHCKTDRYGGDITRFWYEHKNYMQVSCGINHATRNCIVVDIDEELVKKRKNEDLVAYGKRVGKQIEKSLKSWLVPKHIPLPSYINIHNTNGHLQLGYLLECGVRIKDYYLSDDGISVTSEHTNWFGFYYDTLKTLTFLLNGDPAFTGWMIKNPLNSDKHLANDFTLFVYNNDNDKYEYVQDKSNVSFFEHNFATLYNATTNAKKDILQSQDNFLEQIKQSGFATEDTLPIFGMLNLINVADAKTQAQYKSNTTLLKELKSNKTSDNYWRSMSRNRFTRIYTYYICRETNGKITLHDAINTVRKKYKQLNTTRFDGTKNNNEFTEQELVTNVKGAYEDSKKTFKEFKGRSRRIMSGQSLRHLSKLYTLTLIMEENPSLIECTKKNAIILGDMISHSHKGITKLKHQLKIQSFKKYDKLPDVALRVVADSIKSYNEQCKYVEQKVNFYTEASSKYQNSKKIKRLLAYWTKKYSYFQTFMFATLVCSLSKLLVLIC